MNSLLPYEPPTVNLPSPMIYVTNVLGWEYKQVVRDLSKETPLNEEELNKFGAEGWELGGILSQGNQAHYYFKRQSE
jgi:hypothetical protein